MSSTRSTPNRRESKEILVVDDSAAIRRIIRSELERGGYRVHEAPNGSKALEWIRERPQPDLITLDVEMPELNGFETLRALRKEPYCELLTRADGSTVPVVFITSNDTLDDRKTGFSLGAATFVTKPFVKGEVLSIVNKMLVPEKRLYGLKALVVDDSRTGSHIITDCLQKEGIDVVTATDGAQAFEIICKGMNDIALVITDLMMPGMNGDELCRKIREELNLQNLPVIFLTAVPDQSRLLEVFKAGATDYLVKPFMIEELIARLIVHLDRTQLNKRLKEAFRELHKLNVMKDNLLTICSHDLKAPLNGIMGFAELLLEKDYLETDDKDGVSQIKTSGQFLLSLINDILDLGKIEAAERPETELCSVIDLVRSSVRAMTFLAESKKQTIVVTDNAPGAMAPVNKTGIMRVINNLLSNAIKYTAEEGRIELTTSQSAPDRIRLSIIDSGIGVPVEKIPHLFDKFTQASRAGTAGEESTGLGLSIVKAIVDKHGGQIRVDSRVGEGTTIDVVLPCTSPQNGTQRPQAAANQELKAQCGRLHPESVQVPPRKVLLAEDNPVNVKLAKRILARGGHTVTVADDGLLAVEAARKERFDIIFMDIEMPNLGGCEAARELRERDSLSTPIIALTAHTSQDIIDECHSAGMNDVMNKPFSAKDIDEVVQKWCGDTG